MRFRRSSRLSVDALPGGDAGARRSAARLAARDESKGSTPRCASSATALRSATNTVVARVANSTPAPRYTRSPLDSCCAARPKTAGRDPADGEAAAVVGWGSGNTYVRL